MTVIVRLAGLMAACVLSVSGFAAELKLLSGGAVEPGLRAAVAAYEKHSGNTVVLTFNTAPQIARRLAAGDVFDVVIAPPGTLKEFVGNGKFEDAGQTIGRVGLGVAVRPGAAAPSLASSEAFFRDLASAERVVFNLASTGLYFENLLKQRGLWPQVEAKAVRYQTGAEVMKHVLAGKGAEIAVGPITEIRLELPKGLVFVGPLPADIQNVTSYAAAVMTGGASKDAARGLAAFLAGPVGKPLFAAAGIE